jgi:hypothetical protein
MDLAAGFIWISMFFGRAFEYGNGEIFKLLRWMQKLHQSTCDHEFLNADRSSKGDKLLIRLLLQETKNSNKTGG